MFKTGVCYRQSIGPTVQPVHEKLCKQVSYNWMKAQFDDIIGHDNFATVKQTI